jgi:hypothetical protein
MNSKVVLCLATAIFMAAVCLATDQTASNTATVSGGGNVVGQSNEQNAFGSGATQTASNDADVFGSGNRVGQGNRQNAFGSGATQSASNDADVFGSGNTVGQSNTQNAFGSGASQSASNTANVFGSGNRVGQSNVQNAQPMALIYPGSSVLEQRVWYDGGWILGPAYVCVQGVLDTAIQNDRNQLIRTHELYPDGHIDVSEWIYHPAGDFVQGVFVGDALGQHLLRAEGSVSGFSPDIVTIQVVPCGYTGPSTGGSGWVSQSASNTANVGGSGNTVGQSNVQNAFGSGASQSASNTANVFGSGNRVGQSNRQNAFGSGATQTASNDADVFGSGNTVGQSNEQNAFGSGASQSASNDADIYGNGNSVSQGNTQNA